MDSAARMRTRAIARRIAKGNVVRILAATAVAKPIATNRKTTVRSIAAAPASAVMALATSANTSIAPAVRNAVPARKP